MSKQFMGVFEKMEFPPYEFREYPKMLTLKNGTKVTVQNQAEELRHLTEVKEAQKNNTFGLSQEEVSAVLSEKDAEIEALKKALELSQTAAAVDPVKEEEAKATAAALNSLGDKPKK